MTMRDLIFDNFIISLITKENAKIQENAKIKEKSASSSLSRP